MKNFFCVIKNNIKIFYSYAFLYITTAFSRDTRSKKPHERIGAKSY